MAGKPAGFALFFHNFSTWLGKPGLYLEDLFVPESMRGKGIGKALLLHLAGIARERGCGRMEWSVLDWNPLRSIFTRRWAPSPWTDGRCSGSIPTRWHHSIMKNADECTASRTARTHRAAGWVATKYLWYSLLAI